jgi:uncharacterized protein DUF3332
VRSPLVLMLGLACFGGCIGSFRLTRTVYAFNVAVTDDKVLREALFVGFLIVPVYEVSVVVDGVVLNTIELVNNENPLETTMARTSNGRRVAVTSEDDGSLTLDVEGERLSRVLRRGRSLELVQGEEVLAVVSPTDEGGVRISAAGRVRELGPDEVQRLRGLDGKALMEAIAQRW